MIDENLIDKYIGLQTKPNARTDFTNLPSIAKKHQLSTLAQFFVGYGITRYRIAKILGVSPTSVYRWFNYANISDERLEELWQLKEVVVLKSKGNKLNPL